LYIITGDIAMVDYVKLTRQDLDILIEVSQHIVDYKHRTLKPENWSIFESVYLPRLIEALDQNSWKVAQRHNNIFKWIEDQIRWARILTPGLKPKDCPNLSDTELGQEAIDICQTASRGAVSYKTHRSQNTDLLL
jgi:hypothetical protein